MSKAPKIDDAGQIVPYARKHMVVQKDLRESGNVTLSEIWPEPDWQSLVQSGQPRQLLARKFIGYQSIRNKPRAGGIHGFTADQWERAYREAVGLLREIYEVASDEADLYKIADKLRDRLKLTKKECHPASEHNLVFWAAGLGGERTLKGPGPSTLRLSSMAQWLGKLGWPESTAAWKASIVPVQLERDRTWRVSQVEGNYFRFIDETVYPDEESVLAAARSAAIEKERDISNSTKLIPHRPKATASDERIGPDHRNGADVTPDELMDAFGLRAIQFGNSVSAADRQRWTNQTFDSLADMAEVLNMQRKWIGLRMHGESLALAIGARGAGLSAASAHYEQGLRVINQTYRNGFGTLAHEFGHALDHRVGMRSGSDIFLSQHYDYFQYGLTYSAKDREIVRQIETMVKFMTNPHSKYFRQAQKIAKLHRAGNYWTDTVELFARSFEAYVQDKLLQMGRRNPALVHGTLVGDYNLADVIACPYPIEEERNHLNRMHECLIQAIIT